VKQNGSTRVPYGLKTKDGFNLGSGVVNKRAQTDLVPWLNIIISDLGNAL
jgi:hypothetical protein